MLNSDLMRWLLDVRVIPPGDQQLRLTWEHGWPAWSWALLVLAAAAFSLWSYRHIVGSRTGRGILAASRALLLVLLLILIAGPALELPRETVEQDWAIMLLDRSASMTIKDAGDPTRRESRDEQLRAALAGQRQQISDLADDHHVVWMGFHNGAFNLEGKEPSSNGATSGGGDRPTSASTPDLGPSDGRRTDLDGALQQALERAAARPVSGIVVFSDGRTDSPPARALVRRLQSESIPVFVVPLGSAEPVGDLAIRRVEAPRRAFIRDKVPVVVELDRLGAAMRESGGSISLVDKMTGEKLDQIDLKPGDDREAITLTAEPKLAGQATWDVVVSTPQPDLIPENNVKSFEIELVDRPLRVLYIEGYPRWEYHYVKNLMVREKSITSSVLLISADREFAQEGNQPITRLPRSAEELAAYDVIIIGDVPATFFSAEQLNMIRSHVSDRGAGLLWIAGERSLPGSYAGSALSDLLPMRGSLNLPSIGEPVTMSPTPLAERLGVLRLTIGSETGWPAALSDPASGWSRLFYAQKIEPAQLKPAAEVLAQTAAAVNGASLPLVINMRYGAGQCIYVATDEIWRWRYGRGEALPDQFWMQMIRMLGRDSLSNSGESATLEANPRRVPVNQPVRIELRLLDAQLVQSQRPTARVNVLDDRNQHIAELELRRVEGSEDRFAATWLPDEPGALRLTVDDPTLPGLKAMANLEVFAPDDELRHPETDHALLKSLAEATGGRVLAASELSELSRLPNRSVITKNPLVESIWDSPLSLILALLAVTFEWVGRKVLRLV